MARYARRMNCRRNGVAQRQRFNLYFAVHPNSYTAGVNQTIADNDAIVASYAVARGQ